MSNFHPGQRIRVRGEEWQIEHARKHQIGNGDPVWEIHAKGLSNIVAGSKFVFLNDIDTIDVVDPSKIDPEISTSGRAIRAKLYWEAHLRRLLPRNGAIYLGQHGACKPFQYQLQPAYKALNMMRPRILIGDSVGLGKTIECGILLAELIRRGRGKRVLCAVPKATLEQFQKEMWGRFSIPFHRLDSKGLEKLRQDLPSTMNPFFQYDKAIISIDTLKLKKYQMLLENCDWDVLVIDECHNVADRTDGAGGSARHRIARRLAERSNAVVLMSATPHDGTKEGFASLIKLIDRTRISDETAFKAEDFAQHFIRRTRSQVASELDKRAPRKQRICNIPMTDAEVDILRTIHNGENVTSYLTKKSSGMQKELFKTTLIKSFLSSPQALLETVQKKLKALTSNPGRPEADQEAFVSFLRDIEADLQALPTFSRFQYLKEYIKAHPTKDDDRLVIFTERLATMRELESFLLKENLVDAAFDLKADSSQPSGRLVAVAQGAHTDVELPKIVKAFQAKTNGVQILVATNVASEGLNLHNSCHRLIHFDLPWSLITLEQRNGRIDRLGQNLTPEIFYFASDAGSAKKTSSAKDFKDDFWIIEKIKRRVDTAAADMDEEAMAKFSESGMEEAANTEKYETGQVESDLEAGTFLALMASAAAVGNETSSATPTRRMLPTLFEKSPSDFVTNLAREAKLDVDATDGSKIVVRMNNSLRFEVQQWPREYRPDLDADEIVLDADASRMQREYERSISAGVEVGHSFMNEIHPFISLLENTAMGFFPGNKVPTVTLKGAEKDVVYFLVQSSLFNSRNDVVDQFWQILYHKKGSPDLKALVDMADYDHAVKITAWLNDNLKNIKQKPELSVAEKRRITDLTKRAVEEMKVRTAACRDLRKTRLQKELVAELSRIKAWESSRKEYLDQVLEMEKEHKEKGLFFLHSRAVRDELDQIKNDSDSYQKFIHSYVATSAEPAIRILGCLVVEE